MRVGGLESEHRKFVPLIDHDRALNEMLTVYRLVAHTHRPMILSMVGCTAPVRQDKLCVAGGPAILWQVRHTVLGEEQDDIQISPRQDVQLFLVLLHERFIFEVETPSVFFSR